MCRSIAEGGRRCKGGLESDLRSLSKKVNLGNYELNKFREKEELTEEEQQEHDKLQDKVIEWQVERDSVFAELKERNSAEETKQLREEKQREDAEKQAQARKELLAKLEAEKADKYTLLLADEETRDPNGSRKVNFSILGSEREQLDALASTEGVKFAALVRGQLEAPLVVEGVPATAFSKDEERATRHSEDVAQGGRYPTGDRTRRAVTSIRLPEETIALANELAHEYNLSVSDVIRRKALAIDLRKHEGHQGSEKGGVVEQRQAFFEKMEREGGLTASSTPEEIESFHRARYAAVVERVHNRFEKRRKAEREAVEEAVAA